LEPKEYQAKTLDLAIQKACEDLNVTKEKLEIEVISNGYRGIFGLVGGKDAHIVVSLKKAQTETRNELVFNRSTSPELNGKTKKTQNTNSEKAIRAKNILEKILEKICVPVSINVVKDDETIQLNINGESGGLLIGKNGQTLDAMQYIVNKIVNKLPEDRKRIVLDTQGYREKRISSITEMAIRLGKKAKKLHKPVSTGPMNSYTRRIVHLALKNDNELTTKSQGEGLNRKIVIYPKH